MLTNSADVQRVVAVWPMMDLDARKPKGKQPVSLAKRWVWLWSRTDADIEEVMEKTGLSRYAAQSALNVAIGNRLVYPDGTVNQYARRFLQVQAAKELTDKKRAKPKKG